MTDPLSTRLGFMKENKTQKTKTILKVELDFALKPLPRGMDLLVRCHRVLQVTFCSNHLLSRSKLLNDFKKQEFKELYILTSSPTPGMDPIVRSHRIRVNPQICIWSKLKCF